jgi:hypothetical protein
MLGASIIILPYEEPLVWLIAALATGAELIAVRRVLSRTGPLHDDFWFAFVCIQIVSWVLVIGFVSWVFADGKIVTGLGMLVVWLLTLPVEYLLLRLGCESLKALTVSRAAIASTVGNVVSAAVTMGMFTLLRWVLV